jgi:ligand-binding SRPBCC domain-containing protein
VVRIVLETKIQAPRERVFDIARDISLHESSASGTGERAVGGVTRCLIGPGESVTWRAKHFGVWQQLTVKVTEFDRPNMFADEMVRGAFKRMRHVHRFEVDGPSTVMVDEFDFEAPFGFVGQLAERLFLERYMRSFLGKRNLFLKEAAEGALLET